MAPRGKSLECGVCFKIINNKCEKLQCKGVCNKWFHLDCLSLKTSCSNVNVAIKDWKCDTCMKPTPDLSGYVDSDNINIISESRCDCIDLIKILTDQVYDLTNNLKDIRNELTELRLENVRLKSEMTSHTEVIEDLVTRDNSSYANVLKNTHKQNSQPTSYIVGNVPITGSVVTNSRVNEPSGTRPTGVDLFTTKDKCEPTKTKHLPFQRTGRILGHKEGNILNGSRVEAKGQTQKLEASISALGIQVENKALSNQSEVGFKVVNNKKNCKSDNNQQQYKRNSFARPITGSADGHSQLRAVEKYKFLFVSRLAADLSVNVLEDYLRERQVNDFDVVQLKNRHPGYSSFKIGIPISLWDKVYKPDFWTKGVYVSPFWFPRKSSGSGAVPNSFLVKEPNVLRVT